MANTTLIIGLLAVALIVSAMGTLTAVTKFSTGLATEGTTTADVSETADITLSPTTVSFGDIAIGASKSTPADAAPFGIKNDGSVNVDVTIVSTQLWDTQASASNYYKAKCWIDTVACGAGSPPGWVNIPIGVEAAVKVIGTLPFDDAGDQNFVDIYIEAPQKEPAAPVEATITFSATAT